MPRDFLTTSQVPKAAGVHPNTIRLYDKQGYLSPVSRTPKGYRRFSEFHLDQARVARMALRCCWLVGDVRQSAFEIIRYSAGGSLDQAHEQTQRMLAQIQAERDQAEAAAAFLQQWARGKIEIASLPGPLSIGETAKLLNTTVDSLRNWERNGLIEVPRNPNNGYRQYGASEISRLRVIRMLLRSGYSAMAVLRMMLRFDQGQKEDLRLVLDTPRPDEDIITVSDRWLSSLAELEANAVHLLEYIQALIPKYSGRIA